MNSPPHLHRLSLHLSSRYTHHFSHTKNSATQHSPHLHHLYLIIFFDLVRKISIFLSKSHASLGYCQYLHIFFQSPQNPSFSPSFRAIIFVNWSSIFSELVFCFFPIQFSATSVYLNFLSFAFVNLPIFLVADLVFVWIFTNVQAWIF